MSHDDRGKPAVLMYGYNGRSPGPLLEVTQGSSVSVRYHNDTRSAELRALARRATRQPVRWRGRSDAADASRRAAASRTRVHFPDAGIYWYHPHVREDIQQDARTLRQHARSLAATAHYYQSRPIARRVLTLDDLLVDERRTRAVSEPTPRPCADGPLRQRVLVNGEPRLLARRANAARSCVSFSRTSRARACTTSRSPARA